MKRTLVDPFLVFDSKGRSLSSYEEMEQTIERQRRQIERLMRMLRARSSVDVAPDQPQAPSLH